MESVETRPAFVAACDAARAAGEVVGIVPTMGALHEGHLSLIARARSEGASFVCVTIFVNPLQFGPGEDLERYPRPLAADLAACESNGVDLVFMPSDGEMYGEHHATTVRVEGLTAPLEGAHRPGHFDGVTTVVTKLLNLAAPCVAVFGRKDHQQQAIIRRMVSDLDIRARVVAAPTVREPDGLALSSRNRYLDADQRTRATAIVRGLRAANALWAEGERDPRALVQAAEGVVARAFDRVDYVAAVHPDRLTPVSPGAPRVLLAVAAHLGATRLIDNAILGADEV